MGALAFWYSLGAVMGLSSSSFLQVPSFVPQSAVVTLPEQNVSFIARPAAFGPVLGKALEGQMAAVKKGTYGCESVIDKELEGKVVLVERGECSFYEKVLKLQESGAKAVIVGDNVYRRGLVTMYTELDDEVVIPSVFVSKDTFEVLRDSGMRDVIIMVVDMESGVIGTIVFLMLSPLCSLSIIYCVLMISRRYKKMKERASKSVVAKLPTRIWVRPEPEPSASSSSAAVSDSASPVNEDSDEEGEKLWTSSGECIICMEDYEDGVTKIMRLPCYHEFHVDCITRWLTTRKKTCPICKCDVTSKPGQQTPKPQHTASEVSSRTSSSSSSSSEETSRLLVSDNV